LTNDVPLQRQSEAINNERTVDNKAVHVGVVEEIVAEKAATVGNFSDAIFTSDNDDSSRNGKY